ncbi:MAG: DUF4012 domain-containing protein [Mycobacteriales bacterium]
MSADPDRCPTVLHAVPIYDELPAADLRPPPPPQRRRKRPSRRRFWLRRAVVLLTLSVIGGLGWLAVSAVQARAALLRAQSSTASLRLDISRGDIDAAAARLDVIGRDTRRARRLTSGPLWALAGRVPVAGQTLRTVSGLADAADALSVRVLPRLVSVARASSGGALRNGNRINVPALQSMHDELAVVATELAPIARAAQALPDGLLLTPVATARGALLADVRELSITATKLREATSIAPAMLGAGGIRRYFVALQTNAEMRGSGGLLGAYAIVEAVNGEIRLTQLGSNTELRDTYPEPTPGLNAADTERYERFGADGFWLNSNMSAHFPTVNMIWSSMYERTTGTKIDGSIAVDPVVLAEILKATGPASAPDGESISADTIVSVSEQQIYARYPAIAQDAIRNRLQLTIARALYERLVAPVSHDVGLLPQLGAAAAGGHVRIASNHAAEADVLARTSVGGVLPAAEGAYLQVALNNAGGTKLDYYLQPSIRYAFEAARAQQQDVSVAIGLKNTAPTSGLPEYVVTRPDLPSKQAPIAGQNRLHVSVYAGRGATLRGASLDGVPLALETATEQGHAVWSAFVTIDPGQERTLVLALTEPGTEQVVTLVPPATVLPAAVDVVGGLRR